MSKNDPAWIDSSPADSVFSVLQTNRTSSSCPFKITWISVLSLFQRLSLLKLLKCVKNGQNKMCISCLPILNKSQALNSIFNQLINCLQHTFASEKQRPAYPAVCAPSNCKGTLSTLFFCVLFHYSTMNYFSVSNNITHTHAPLLQRWKLLNAHQWYMAFEVTTHTATSYSSSKISTHLRRCRWQTVD
jgi:hypothetical protein